jgi:hypothetical protein
MSVVSDNIAIITAQAATLDTLITDFQTAKAAIEAAELAIRKEQPNANHAAHAGRIRLAEYARALMGDPNLNGGQSVASLATAAWTGVS